VGKGKIESSDIGNRGEKMGLHNCMYENKEMRLSQGGNYFGVTVHEGKSTSKVLQPVNEWIGKDI